MFYVCLYYTILSIPCNLAISCWERADLLALLCVMFPCALSLSHVVFGTRCGSLGTRQVANRYLQIIRFYQTQMSVWIDLVLKSCFSNITLFRILKLKKSRLNIDIFII